MTGIADDDPLPNLPPIKGRTVLIVGCGEGRIVRLAAERGAAAVGIEWNPKRLAAARAAKPAADERYLEGDGDSLPFPESSADVVVFFGTLHHVPAARQAAAIREAARVLRPRGVAYVTEPLAQGPYFELLQPVDDETEVRARACAAIKGAGADGLLQDREFVFDRVMRFRDFEAFRALVLTIDPSRSGRFAEREPEMRTRFARHGRIEAGEHAFDQPFRVNILRKP